MKKLILSTLSIALIAGGMTSCGKSSTGKMSNDWTVDSYEMKDVETAANGNTTTTTTKISDGTMTQTTTSSQSPSSSTTTTANVPTAEYTIKKDGTWSSAVTMVNTLNPTATVSIVTTRTETTSGTWAFVGKNKDEDFKKNERVIFNTLQSTSTETTATTTGSTTNTSTSSDTDTYMTGDNVTIYTITESKKKELQLTSEAKQTNTSSSSGSPSSSTSSSVTTTINLIAK